MFHINAEAIESVNQLSEMWGKLVADVNGAVTDDEGLAVRWADAKFAFYNALVVTAPVETEEQLRRLLLRSSEFMDGRAQPGCVWLFDDLVSPNLRAEIGSLARESGLISSFTCWGMAGDLITQDEPSHPLLRFERVTSAQHLDAYASLNARAYGLSEEDAMSTFRGSRLWREEIFAFVAYEGSNPVACAGACVVDGRLFLVLVATEAKRRRLGFGEAVTRKALYEASQSTGIKRVCLQATADGKPVYERIGLRSNSSLQLFSRHSA
ncbi:MULTISPECIES: GNAT family N-acetyltransferase [Rhizobium]|jgi:hypothetical protein|uniref:GNAT family N-acetyltransferase n=2 Tax=Rhizobium/Agrobacterium group TaxID=227290 RepID=UPI0003748F1D|nr:MULTISPECIES: GNAT family N-acetyltransferase [Rhizobium]TAY85824.1 N-acetyltransferase [Rhizobium ruizarguesonis]TAZ70189.1 N-acetyltransferase [Rhizobium ruizarguesonis]TAZ92747.1 N-acetyltransferase [Rhizobium ruizarguesonis]TBA11375.1 N-acetyltransferase [Rhizobium ruizarguesonis]TBA33903.1 N-acetyltransferase [Rhizobium ruizarguesonis]